MIKNYIFSAISPHVSLSPSSTHLILPTFPFGILHSISKINSSLKGKETNVTISQLYREVPTFVDKFTALHFTATNALPAAKFTKVTTKWKNLKKNIYRGVANIPAEQLPLVHGMSTCRGTAF
jgi:hypothetical protein